MNVLIVGGNDVPWNDLHNFSRLLALVAIPPWGHGIAESNGGINTMVWVKVSKGHTQLGRHCDVRRRYQTV